MPSLQSIALLAAASTASANYLGGDYDAGLYDLSARDVYDGDYIYERDVLNDIDGLMQHYQRDFDDAGYSEGQFMIREAKGGAGKAITGALKGAGKGASAFGNIGTGLTGISDIVNTFKGNGNGKRDLEGDYEDSELFVRTPKISRPSAASIGHGISAVGHGASSGAEAFGHVGDGLTGISNIVNLFKGGKGKRDLDDLYEGITLYARQPRGGFGSNGFLSSLAHGHDPSSPSSSGQGSSTRKRPFGTLLHGLSSAGHSIGSAGSAFGLANLERPIGANSQGNANSKRDLEDLYDQAELFVREVFGRGSSSLNVRDLDDLLDAADEIVVREELALEQDY